MVRATHVERDCAPPSPKPFLTTTYDERRLNFSPDGQSDYCAQRVTPIRGAFTPSEPHAWSHQTIAFDLAHRTYFVPRDGTRVMAVVPDVSAEQRSRHVVTLWTNAVGKIEARASGEQR